MASSKRWSGLEGISGICIVGKVRKDTAIKDEMIRIRYVLEPRIEEGWLKGLKDSEKGEKRPWWKWKASVTTFNWGDAGLGANISQQIRDSLWTLMQDRMKIIDFWMPHSAKQGFDSGSECVCSKTGSNDFTLPNVYLERNVCPFKAGCQTSNLADYRLWRDQGRQHLCETLTTYLWTPSKESLKIRSIFME